MDKVTLTNEQLHQLVIYIRSRGFKEPLIIAELLDHFACKVEEKLLQEPDITLKAAMNAAHSDFGPTGFMPLVNAYKGNIKKKYMAIYRRQLKQNLTQPRFILPAIAVAVFFYQAVGWCSLHNYNHILDTNDAVTGLTLILLGSLGYLSYQFRVYSKANSIFQVLTYADVWVAVFLGANPLQHFQSGSFGFVVWAMLYSAGGFYLFMRHISVYQALKTGYDDSVIVYEYLKSVQG